MAAQFLSERRRPGCVDGEEGSKFSHRYIWSWCAAFDLDAMSYHRTAHEHVGRSKSCDISGEFPGGLVQDVCLFRLGGGRGEGGYVEVSATRLEQGCETAFGIRKTAAGPKWYVSQGVVVVQFCEPSQSGWRSVDKMPKKTVVAPPFFGAMPRYDERHGKGRQCCRQEC